MKNLNGVSLWQCKWHNCLIFNYLQMYLTLGLMPIFFLEKWCWQNFDQIGLKDNWSKYMEGRTILLATIYVSLGTRKEKHRFSNSYCFIALDTRNSASEN